MAGDGFYGFVTVRSGAWGYLKTRCIFRLPFSFDLQGNINDTGMVAMVGAALSHGRLRI